MSGHITAAEELRLLRLARGFTPAMSEVTPPPASHRNNLTNDYQPWMEEVEGVWIEEKDPAKRERMRKKALQKLLEAHKPFIVSIVRGYMLTPRLDMDDLLAEANVGFIEAIDRYDFDKGYRINTFAIFRVKVAIEDYISKAGYATKIPFPEVVKTRKLLNRQDVNLNDATRADLIDILHVAGLTVDESRPLDELRKRAVKAIHGNKNVNIASLIKGTMSMHPHESAEESRTGDYVNAVEAKMAVGDVAADVMSDLTVAEIQGAIDSLDMIEALPLMYALGMIDESPARLKKSSPMIGVPYNLNEHCYKNAVDQVRRALRSLKET